MKTFLKIFCLAAIVASCDDVEPTVFHGEDPSNQTYLSFSNDVYSLPVERDANGVSTIVLNASTVSGSDRVYNLEVIAGTANPATYSVPSSVTIPAGEYVTSFEITGSDNGLVDEEIKSFTIKISDASISNESLGFSEAVVSVFEVCPLLADFTGSYALESSADLFTGLPPFQSGNVTLSVGSNAYERVFVAGTYPGYGGNETVSLNFQCDYVNLGGSIDTGVYCTEGNSLKFQPSDDPATYNTEDDSFLSVNFIQNSTTDCGAPSAESTFTLTKNN